MSNPSILSALFHRIELHIDTDPEFTRFFGARVKALGGRYSDVRGHSDKRYVTLNLDEKEALKLAQAILAKFPASTVILRDPKRSGEVRAMDGYPAGGHVERHDGFVNAYGHTSGNEVYMAHKVEMRAPFCDLSAVERVVTAKYEKLAAKRIQNGIALANRSIARALDRCAMLCAEHAKLVAHVDTALCVALDRLELGIRRGQLDIDAGSHGAAARTMANIEGK